MYVHDIIIYDARCKGTTQQKEKASAVCANYSDWNLCYIVYYQNTSFKINSRRYDISNLSACDDFYYMLYVEWSHSSQYRL